MSYKYIISQTIKELNNALITASTVLALRNIHRQIIANVNQTLDRDNDFNNNTVADDHYNNVYQQLSLTAPKKFLLIPATVKAEKTQGKTLNKKKLKKRLHLLIEHAITEKQIAIETPDDLLREVLRTKNARDLQKLYDGNKTPLGMAIPTLEERYRLSAERFAKTAETSNSVVLATWEDIQAAYTQKLNYLSRVKTVQVIATVLTVISSIILGIVAATAIVLAFPIITTLPLPGFIAVFTAITLAGSLTEGLVWYGYLKKFFLNIVNKGLFQRIDNFAIKQALKKKYKNNPLVPDRFDLSHEQQTQLLAKSWSTRTLKKLLSILVIPFALIAGIGFAAITYANILDLMGIFHLATSGVMLALPWTLAIIIGSVFAMIMYKMIQDAVMKNIFYQIKEKLIKLFEYKGNISWENLPWYRQALHWFLSLCKAILVFAVLAISVAATYFMASECFNGIIAFCKTSLDLMPALANQIGIAVGIIMLANEFSFTLENSLSTANLLLNMTWQKLKHNFKHPVQTIINMLAFIVHVAGMGAITAEGAAGTHWGIKILAGGTGATSEALQDLHAIIETEDEHHCHGHNHDVAGTTWTWFKSLFGGTSPHHHPAKTASELKPLVKSPVLILQALSNIPKDTAIAESLATSYLAPIDMSGKATAKLEEKTAAFAAGETFLNDTDKAALLVHTH